MELAKDVLKITVLSLCALVLFIIFLTFADGFISAMNNPTMCESLAKSFRELAQCP